MGQFYVRSTTPTASNAKLRASVQALRAIGEVNIFFVPVVGLRIHEMVNIIANNTELHRPMLEGADAEEFDRMEHNLLSALTSRQKATGLHISRALAGANVSSRFLLRLRDEGPALFSCSAVEELLVSRTMLLDAPNDDVRSAFRTAFATLEHEIDTSKAIWVYVRPTEGARSAAASTTAMSDSAATRAYIQCMDKSFFSRELCEFARSHHTMVVETHETALTQEAVALDIFQVVADRVGVLFREGSWGNAKAETLMSQEYMRARVAQSV